MSWIARRLSAAQATSGMVSGIYTPFFGAWLAWRGLSAGEIATLLSAGLLLRAFVVPVTGIIADARNDRRATMLVLYWIMFAGYGALSLVSDPLLVFLAAVPATVASGATTPLLESVSVRLAERNGYEYGKVRIWASSAFVVLNLLGGISLWRFGTWVVAPWLGLTSALCVYSIVRLPAPPPDHPRGNFFSGLWQTFGEAGELLRSWPFMVFLIASSLAQSSHAFYYGYGGLHWRALGYSGVLIGAIWPLGVFAEIALFSFSRRVLKIVGPTDLLFWGGAACVLRWTMLAFDPPLAIVIVAQFLHGATFAMTHLGAMNFILRAIPPRLAATAQSLYFVCSAGIVMGIATYASGLIYADFGGRAYLLMSAMGLLAMVFAVLLARAWHGGRVTADEHEEHFDTI